MLDSNPSYIGPAAIVQAARFNFDSRDAGFAARAEALNQPDGVWSCENLFECTRVCPRGIKVTKTINLTKRLIQKRIPGSGLPRGSAEDLRGGSAEGSAKVET